MDLQLAPSIADLSCKHGEPFDDFCKKEVEKIIDFIEVEESKEPVYI